MLYIHVEVLIREAPLYFFLSLYSSFFGNFGFHFGGDGGGPREIPRGGTLTMDFGVSLEDLYVGNFIELARFKAVPKPAQGTRQCNCRTEMKTIQMGPGRFQVRTSPLSSSSKLLP